MKKQTLLLLALLVTVGAQAQREDNIWAFGYNSLDLPEHPGTERIFFDFSDDSLNITYTQSAMNFDNSNASLCDAAGNLRLLCNGCRIADAEGSTVPGADSLNPGLTANLFCDSDYYTILQNAILLPEPGNPDIAHLFHYPVVQSGQYIFSRNVLHSAVDLAANGGQGSTLLKNQPIVLDSLDSDGLHAVRHANGRDWWIVAAKQYSNTYHFVLLGTQGVSAQSQPIGPPTWSGAGGEIVFSPDGSKMARFNTRDDLRLFDFDRCTGTLSNPRHVTIQDDADNQLFAGLAFSHDGRYLYAAEVLRVLQFDLQAPDLAASMTTVAEREPENCPFSSSLAYLELGPDGRIYGRNLAGSYCMHLMKYPERAGTACGFDQNAINFGTYGYKNLPHFPNFRLGPLDGSPCDSLGMDNLPRAAWRYDRSGGSGADFTSLAWGQPAWHAWDFADSASGTQNASTEANPAHNFSAPGAYEVCLTVGSPHGTHTHCKTVWVGTSSTGEAPAGSGLGVFPNPTSGWVQWGGTSGPVSVRVFDAPGRLVAEQNTAEGRADLSLLQDGLYILTLRTEGGAVLHTQRLLIAKQ
jgi:hypothetical protein